MEPIAYIKQKYNVDGGKGPIQLPISRKGLPELFAELGYKEGAEVGVEKGRYSKRLCQGNPDLLLHSIDAWAAYSGYRDHVTQRKLDMFYEETKQRLEPFNCNIIRGFSVEVANQFENGSLDFVYIDGNHEFSQVTADIHAWEPKVRKGGIVSGHDYRRGDSNWTCHVKDVVQAWTYSHGIRTWFITTDRSPSWLWVQS